MFGHTFAVIGRQSHLVIDSQRVGHFNENTNLEKMCVCDVKKEAKKVIDKQMIYLQYCGRCNCVEDFEILAV